MIFSTKAEPKPNWGYTEALIKNVIVTVDETTELAVELTAMPTT
jgi:hypothetical protein